MARLPARGRYALAAAYAAYVLYASVVEPPDGALAGTGPLGVLGVDKWLHLLTYATLALLLGYAALARSPRTLAAVALAAAAYGAGVEGVQAFLPARAFDPADAAANAAGAALGVAAWRALRVVGARRERPSE